MSKPNAVFFFALWILLPVVLKGQCVVHCQRLTTEEGLSQNTVNTIFQDSKGFIWLGTYSGLDCYTAARVVNYTDRLVDTLGFQNSEVYAIYEDEYTTLWVGTGAGLTEYDRKKDSFKNYQFAEGTFAMRPVWSILGKPGSPYLWIGASGGLFRFDKDTKRFLHFKLNKFVPDANSIKAMTWDDDGNLWICPKVGPVRIFNTTAMRFMHVADAQLTTIHNATSILKDGSGNMWIGQQNGILYRYQLNEHVLTEFTSLKDKLPILSLGIKRDRQLWVGTDKGGIYTLDHGEGILKPLFKAPVRNDPQVILSLLNDVKGDMWAGTFQHGAYLFDPIDTAVSTYMPHPEANAPAFSNSVTAVARDGKGLWLGTDGGGLIYKEGDRVRYYSELRSGGVAGNSIISIAKDPAGLLYFGTYGKGLSIYNPRTKVFRTFDKRNGLVDNNVWNIYVENNNIWLATDGGITVLDSRSGRTTTYVSNIQDKESVSSNSVRCFYRDSRKRLWIGTVSGLNVFHEEDSALTGSFHRITKENLVRHNITCIYEDTLGIVWFGTYGGGLSHYDYATDVFRTFVEADGLSGNIVYGIVSDKMGGLWISTNKGLSRLDVKSHSIQKYQSNIGIANAQFNARSALEENGRIYFGTTDGLLSFSPSHLRINAYVPELRFTNLELYNDKVAGIHESTFLEYTLVDSVDVRIDYGSRLFSISYAALNFSHASENKYKYKLEPFDKDWVNAGHITTATYTNLDPGTYRFRVKGSNNDGIWNNHERTLKIFVVPRFYQSLSFKILVCVATMSILFLFLLFKEKRSRWQKLILTKLVKQRTSELREKNRILIKTENENVLLVNQRLSEEVVAKSRELANCTLLIIKKNQIMSELKNHLKDFLRDPGSMRIQDFKKIIQMINLNFNSENEWHEFDNNFDRVHAGFLEALRAKFPALTENDLKLCALFRIDISAKNIAAALGISLGSVKMARYRLRKKLMLNPDDDIHKFLRDNF